MSELKPGMRVKFTEYVECYPAGIIEPGETGTICNVDLDSWGHTVEVLLDKVHDGFKEWDNKLHMTHEKDAEYPSIHDNCIPI